MRGNVPKPPTLVTLRWRDEAGTLEFMQTCVRRGALYVLGSFWLFMVSCAGESAPPAENAQSVDAAENPEWDRGIADLFPKSNSDVRGTLVLRETPGGLQIKGRIEALEKGSFALSMHVDGDCSSHDAKSVGDVFNPTEADPPAGLLGDARGNNETQEAQVELLAPDLELNGPNTVLGHSVVVHAWPTDPAVDWDRVPFLACGVIEAG